MLGCINFGNSGKTVVTFSLLMMNLAQKLDLLFHWVLMQSKRHNYISGNSISPSIFFYSSEHTVGIIGKTVRDFLADASIMPDDIRGSLQLCCCKLTAFKWHALTRQLSPAAFSCIWRKLTLTELITTWLQMENESYLVPSSIIT